MTTIPTPPKPERRAHAMGEAAMQASCVRWIWNECPETRGLFVAIPNENARSVYESRKRQLVSGAIRKNMGVVAGVADTALFLPRGKFHGLFVEFKAGKGRQSEAQKAWEEKAKSAGYYYAVIRSLEEFRNLIKGYLSLK